MNLSKLKQLGRVTEAMYLKEYDKIRPILEAEARLRAQMTALDRQRQEVIYQAGHSPSYQALGAEVVWQGWESRTRRTLNSELAQARAKRLTAMEGLALAFGRKEAIAGLSAEASTKAKAAEKKKTLERLGQAAALRERS